MPARAASRLRASGKVRPSRFMTKLKMSPPSPQPKQCQLSRAGVTTKLGVFSPWNGQSPLYVVPALRSSTCSPTISRTDSLLLTSAATPTAKRFSCLSDDRRDADVHSSSSPTRSIRPTEQPPDRTAARMPSLPADCGPAELPTVPAQPLDHSPDRTDRLRARPPGRTTLTQLTACQVLTGLCWLILTTFRRVCIPLGGIDMSIGRRASEHRPCRPDRSRAGRAGRETAPRAPRRRRRSSLCVRCRRRPPQARLRVIRSLAHTSRSVDAEERSLG